MKKLLFISALFLLYSGFIQSQTVQELPIDPKVRIGNLDNGLTYYIRHNELPKERADFYIVQKVGAILEEDNQNGLAHFLEHMAFNGSTHFPGNRVIDYLETIGVKFGANLNAYTSYDQTVYNISNVPVLTLNAIDSCLLILHDWSGSLLLDEKEIDKERGVIREEMRSYGGAAWRMSEKLSPQVMPGSKYAERNIIGTEEIIMNFRPETLREFYKKWYRPDLQAIIIVGDINVDEIENKIKAVFTSLPAPVNPSERVYFPVPDNKETLVGVASDKEATSTRVSIYFKRDPMPREMNGTIAKFISNYFNAIISGVTSERIRDIVQQPNPPFVSAGIGNSSFMGAITKRALIGHVNVKDNNIEMGLKSVSREIERLNRYGITASEYERAKANLISYYENAFNEREKTYNSSYVNEYVDHFTDNIYIPGIEVEYNMISEIAPMIPLEAVNEYIKKLMGEENIVITLTAPEKEGLQLPTKDDLLNWFRESKNEDISPIEEMESDEPLMYELPTGGKIIGETTDSIFGTTNYTLSNGIKVIIKPTQWKDDQILMNGFSPGGSSLFPESEIANIKMYNSISSLGGLGNFSQSQLTKLLAGKQVSVQPYISTRLEGVSGSSSVKDFETLLQLTYLTFTAPRKDEIAYQSYIERLKSQLEQQEANPDIAFSDTLLKEAFVNKERTRRFVTNDLKQVNYDTIMSWRKERYADASDFIFVLVGNIDPEQSKEKIALYLGSLPALYLNQQPVNIVADLTKGIHKNHFNQKMENTKAVVGNMYWSLNEVNDKNRIVVNMLDQILKLVFMEKIREEEGGTYGVSVASHLAEYPEGQTLFQIYFETEPEKVISLNDKVHNEIQKIAENGPRVEDFNKVKEHIQKQRKERIEQNGYWSQIISDFYKHGYNGHTYFVETLNEISLEDIQKMAQSLTNSGNLIEVIMKGVK